MALVRPHGGGNLNPLLLKGKALADEFERALTLPRIKVSSREKGDLVMMGIGGFTPLDGFMSFTDWQGVCAGMKMAMAKGDVNLAGPVKILSLGGFDQKYGELFMTPRETRDLFESMGWSKIAAFQTRNPMHRSHEYLSLIHI